MNPEAQNIAIAETCGWKKREKFMRWYNPANEQLTCRASLPDYCNDLNAMHEAWKEVLGYYSEEWLEAYRVLKGIVAKELGEDKNCPYVQAAVGNATAAQRAEAFLKTLNLWTK